MYVTFFEKEAITVGWQKKPQPENAAEQTGRFSNSLFEWGEALIFSLLFVVIVFTFLFRLIGVSGHSPLSACLRPETAGVTLRTTLPVPCTDSRKCPQF